MRYSAILLVALGVSFPCVGTATEPKAVALEAIGQLFVEHDLATFKKSVAEDAVQGDLPPGSAIAKLEKQRPEQMQTVELSELVFFNKADIDKLAAAYPDNLWPRVRKHIGDQQGVLVRLKLTGELAKRAVAAGKDPSEVAMMTFVFSTDEEPKVVHVDDN